MSTTKKFFFTCLYRFPNQNHEDLKKFCSNLDLLSSNINDQHLPCSIVIGDFNAKCLKWCATDKNNLADLELNSITTTAGYRQMSNKPRRYINNHHLAFDLIFSSNNSFVKNCGK